MADKVEPQRHVAASRPSTTIWWVVVAIAPALAWYVHFWPHFQAANESTRLYLTESLFEYGRPELDAVVARRGVDPVDCRANADHIYASHGPGLAVLSVPLYAAVRSLDPTVEERGLWRVGWLATLILVTLPWLLALAALARASVRAGASTRSSLAAVLAIALASPALIYATLFFGHVLATACIGGALALLVALPGSLGQPGSPGQPGSLGKSRARRNRLLAAGLLAGLAGLVDTPVFMLAVALWGLAMLAMNEGSIAERARATWIFAATVAGLFLVWLGWHAWSLGEAFVFPWQLPPAVDGATPTGFAGLRLPSLDAMGGLWFGARRGLIYHAPWLAAAGLGHVLVLRDQGRRTPAGRLALFCLTAVAVYAVFVSSFAGWDQDDSAGARHLLPIVPLLGLGLAPLLDRRLSSSALAGVYASVLIGVALHAPTVASFPYHFKQIPSPALELAWPLLITGSSSASLGSIVGAGHVTSLICFAGLLIAPWLLLLRRTAPPASAAAFAPRVFVARVSLTIAFLALWATVAVSTIPVLRRAVQGGRFIAAQLLDPAHGRVTGTVRRVPRPAP